MLLTQGREKTVPVALPKELTSAVKQPLALELYGDITSGELLLFTSLYLLSKVIAILIKYINGFNMISIKWHIHIS